MTYLVYNKSKLIPGSSTLCCKGHLHMGPSINGVHKEGERVCLNAKYKLREHYCDKVQVKDTQNFA